MSIFERELARELENRPLVPVLILAFFQSTFSIFSKLLAGELYTYQQITIRTLFAVIFFLFFFSGRLRKTTWKDIPNFDIFLTFIRAMVTFAIAIPFMIAALVNTTVANTVFIGAIPLTPIWGFLFFHERISVKTILALSIGFIGAIILCHPTSSLSFGKGEVYALISNVSLSLVFALRRMHSPKLTDVELSAIYTSFGSLIALGISLFAGEPPLFSISWFALSLSIFAGLAIVFTSILASFTYRRISLALAGAGLALQSFFAPLLSFFIFHEQITPSMLIGGAFIFASVYGVSVTTKNTSKILQNLERRL
jgi:drug/metabolite transporter (DMT)-like permease